MKQASLIAAFCLVITACSSSDGGGGSGEAPGFKLDNPTTNLVESPPSNGNLPGDLLPPP